MLEYLDDRNCAKVFPRIFDREWSSPIPPLQTSIPPPGYAFDQPLTTITVDTTTLAAVVSDPTVHVCAVIINRSNTSALLSRYLCLHPRSQIESFETWSSSKIFAMANAASRLRQEGECIAGLDSFTTGKHGNTPLGDLSTIVSSYDSTASYTSNSVSSYFHDIGWRGNLNSLVNSEWLGAVQGAQAQSLGGNYGESTPSDLGFEFVANDDHTASCTVSQDPRPTTYPNTLSVLSHAEMTRRIVLHREVDSSLRFPGMEWVDAQEILLGQRTSVLFPDLEWGGMAVDPAIFLQSALNMSLVESNSPNWRIFSKLGAGYSTSRGRGEITYNAYGCFPVDASPADGKEFVLSVRGSIPSDVSLLQSEIQVVNTVREVVNFIFTSNL